MTDILLLLAPVALLAAILLALRLTTRRARRPTRPKAAQRPIIVDGSNVLYWRDNTPSLDTLREVIATLRTQCYDPGVVFDANAGYLLTGKYQHDGAPILTNDRYRDWAEAHPEIRTPGHLIRGSYRDGQLRIDLPGPRCPLSPETPGPAAPP